jgi:uncharacterized protein YciI
MSDLHHFVCLLRPPRAGFMQDMTAQEQAIIDRHFEYLKALLERGRLVIAGPCLDAAFGLVVFAAESEADAKALVAADPAVSGGVFTPELHEMRVSLLQAR